MASKYIPIFRILQNNIDITNRFQDRCLSITVELTAGSGAQDSVVIVLDDRDFAIVEPRVKDRLEVHLGYKDVGDTFMGSFEINRVEFAFPPRIIKACGTTASSFNDLKTQRINNFSGGKTVEEILAAAAAPSGFRVDVHKSIADNKIETLNSTITLGGLIQRLEKQYDAVAKITDGRIAIVPRAGGKSVSDFDVPTFVLRDYSFADLIVEKESRGEYAKVVADYLDGDGNRTGVSAQSKIEDIGSEAIFKVPHPLKTREEAQATAESVQAQLDRSGEKISATLAQGDPWVRDLQRIVVSGIRSGVDGSYTLDAVRHTYEKGSGLRTSFTGQGGVNGLAAEFLESQVPTPEPGKLPSFVVAGPDQVFGSVLPPGPGIFGRGPSLVGAPLPTIQREPEQ